MQQPIFGVSSDVVASLYTLLLRADDCASIKDILSRVAEMHGFNWASYHHSSEEVTFVLATLPVASTTNGSTNANDEVQPILSIIDRTDNLVEDAVLLPCGAAAARSVATKITERLTDAGARVGFSMPVEAAEPDGGVLTLYAQQGAAPDMDGAKKFLSTMSLAIHTKIQALPEYRFARSTAALSSRERECISWAAQGKSVAEIAVLMGITDRTVLFHISNVKRRLGAETIAHAVFKSYA